MYQTAIHDLPAPDQLPAGPGPDVPSDIRQLADALDPKLTPYNHGNGDPAAAGVAPGRPGARYRDDTSGDEYLDIGPAWVKTTPPSGGPNGTPALRALGTDPGTAAAGDDPRLSDQRTPPDGSVTAAKIANALKPSQGAGAATEALRALGNTAGTAAAGNDGRIPTPAQALIIASITPYIASLLDDVDALHALSTLGVSAYLQTLLDDPDATTARATLGIPTFSPEAVVNVLPAAPTDGQIVNFLVDAANNVVWRLRYRQASVSAHKWEFLGGQPLRSDNPGPEAFAGGGFANSTTNGGNTNPDVLVPLAGDYRLQWGNETTNDNGSATGAASVAKSRVDPNPPWQVTAYSVQGQYEQMAGDRPALGLVAGDHLYQRYFHGSAGTGRVRNMYIAITPLRVG